MAPTVTAFDGAAAVLDVAAPFLAGDPVRHNLILTLLERRREEPEEGRYWVVSDGASVLAVAFQSPVSFPVLLTPMAPEVAAELADRIARGDVDLPSASGEAATVAAFAGQWSESRRVAARPGDALRLYEAGPPIPPASVAGAQRVASPSERDLLVEWLRSMLAVVPAPGPDPQRSVDRFMAAGRLWVWDDGGPVSLCAESAAVAGTVRVQAVFTPPERRGRGYASAGVAALTGRVLARGQRCALYADLANPVSNGIYRRLGYRAVAEILRYDFSPVGSASAVQTA